MTPAEAQRAEARFWRQSEFAESLYKRLRALDEAGINFLDPERLALHERWCVASEHLAFLFQFTPDARRFYAAHDRRASASEFCPSKREGSL
jgi:hypothetical protein